MGRGEDFLSRPRPWQRSVQEPTCPVGEGEKKWIERSMLWFVDQFGIEAARGRVGLPTVDFYPVGYTGTASQIDELVARVCAVMGMSPDDITVELFDGTEQTPTITAGGRSHAVGHYFEREGRSVIELDQTESADPAKLSAIIAHELGHARLLGERRISSHSDTDEKLTDLVTVFLGMGVFTSNAALGFTKTAHGWSAEPLGHITEQMLAGSGHGDFNRLGYLDEPAFGYALACLCGLRRETDPAWAAYLDPGPRAQLKRSLEYFAHTAARARPGAQS